MMNTIDYLIESQLMEADMVFHQATMEVSLKDRIGEKLTRNKIVDTIRRWLAKIRKFIMDLINGIIKKIKSMYSTHSEWFEEHKHEFDDIAKHNYLGVSFTSVPFWKAHKELMSSGLPIPQLASVSNTLNHNGSHIKTEADIIENFTDFDSKNVTTDIKRYYRGADLDEVETIDKPGDVKKIVDIMIEYCNNSARLIKNCTESQKYLNDALKVIESRLDKADTQEEFNQLQREKLYIETTLRIVGIKLSMTGQCFHTYTRNLKRVLAKAQANKTKEIKDVTKNPIKGNIRKGYKIIRSHV